MSEMIDVFRKVAYLRDKHNLRGVVRSICMGPEQEMQLRHEADGWEAIEIMDRKCCGIPINVDRSLDGVVVEYLETMPLVIGRRPAVDVRKVFEEAGFQCRAI